MARLGYSLPAALLLAGCIPETTDDLSTISRPRLLAIRAAQDCGTDRCSAEIPLSTGIVPPATLEALVAAPDGRRTPGVRWQLCNEPKSLTELGPVNPDCLSAGNPSADPIGSGATLSGVQLPQDACSRFGPNPKQKGGRPSDPDPSGGYYQPVIAFVANAPQLGTIRIDCGPGNADPVEYRARYRPNANPAIDSLSIADGAIELPPWPDGAPGNDAGGTPSEPDAGATPGEPVDGGTGAPIVVPPGARIALRATWARCPRESVCGDGVCGEHEDVSGMPETGPGEQQKCVEDCAANGKPTPRGCTGAETYAWADPSAREIRDRRESIVVTWYATDGSFGNRRTGVSESDPDQPFTENGWAAPTHEKDVLLWLVIRDDRGGVGWQTYRVSVR